MKKSTRVSIVTKNINLSSAAKKRIKKYTTKKTAKAKSICKGNGLFVLSYYTLFSGLKLEKQYNKEVQEGQ